MKKVIFIVLFWVGLTNGVFAIPLGFGIKGGLDMACLVSDLSFPSTVLTTDVVFGFTGGVFVDMGLTDVLSFQSEVNFTMKGNQVNYHHIPVVNQPGAILGYLDGATNTYDYLEIPLLLKAKTLLGPQLQGGLFTGPAPAFLLSANVKYSTSVPGLLTALNMTNFDLGWIVGVGIEFDRFLLDVRYDFSFNNVFPGFINGPNNSVLSLEVGYRIQ